MSNNQANESSKEVGSIEDAKKVLKENSQAVKIAVEQIVMQKETAEKNNHKK
jgi:hypothetical protein